MTKIIRLPFYIIAILVFLYSVYAYMVYTESGLNSMINITRKITGDKFTVGTHTGILARQVELKNIAYHSSDINFSIDDLKLSWQLNDLFKRKLLIHQLNITGLKINSAEKKSSHAFELSWWMPHKFKLSHIIIDNFCYNNISIAHSELDADADISPHKISITQLNAHLSESGNFAIIHLSFKNKLDAEWNINIHNLTHFIPESAGKLISTGIYTQQNIHGLINLTNLRYKTNRVEQFKLNMDGTVHNNTAILSILPRNFIFRSSSFFNWSLGHGVTLIISPTSASIDNLKLLSPYGFVTVAGHWQKNHSWQLTESGQQKIKEYNITPLFNLTEKSNSQNITYAGTIQSGGGILNLHGSTNAHTTQLSVKGSGFLAANSPQYRVWISPDLQLNNRNQQWNLSGNLTIPQAIIIVSNKEDKVISLPKDVVFLDEKSEKSPFDLYSNVKLLLGNDIHVDIQGLTAKIEGSLMLNDNPQQFTTGNGRLNIINGLYRVYGQTLKIKYGSLIFNNSPVTDPGLLIRAVKKINISGSGGTSFNPSSASLIVGSDITGTLETPEIRLFSEPATLSQVDILSYLVLGHSAAEASPFDAQVLLQASLSLDSANKDSMQNVKNNIQNLFGMDKVNIESISYNDPSSHTPDLSQTTALVLGKALSPRLYLTYSAGLIKPVNILTLKYQLSKKWFIQTTGSTVGSGADIFVIW